MCGIVGAVSQRDILETLLEGLRRLEYRGYDSAGLAVVDNQGNISRLRRTGKVQNLAQATKKDKLHGITGIAHTRWATHGEPTEKNAHPHLSDYITVVHNGIIENHEFLRTLLIKRGYNFTSETDTEVIAHLTHWEFKRGGTLLKAFQRVTQQLRGSYGAVIMNTRDPSVLIGARSGSPLVIGLGIGENFIASDQLALLPVTQNFIFLEEGDLAELTCHTVKIIDKDGYLVNRIKTQSKLKYDAGDKGNYRHYMQKDIYEQPLALHNSLKGRCRDGLVTFNEFGKRDLQLLKKVRHIQIVACGTSYHAGMVARHWFEGLVKIPCDVEIASEFRYRNSAVRPSSLIITLSQSGETADTLAALRLSKKIGYLGSLTVCNVAGSSLARESDLVLMTRAGAEISVASTKGFTTQLSVLLMLVTCFGRLNNIIEKSMEYKISHTLQALPRRIEKMLFSIEKNIAFLAKDFTQRQHVLFFGRGTHYPIAMEGALKLKEISYIHAEAYAAGELKHGPLALIDDNMAVIVVAPNNNLLEKLKSNVEEVRTRGGHLYIFTEKNTGFISSKDITTILLPSIEDIVSPIFYTIPLQLLSYHVALNKRTNIDQPRNLAKSVTVE